MFVINKIKNRITQIKACTFSELGFKEREHLQEWLEHNPEVFGEELLFIQKEFDGFDDTRERLDLLAIDKQGNLVIIENKLDDSGRNVTWQVLKYASYCSSLSKQQIKDIYQAYLTKTGSETTSEENIAEFLDAEDFGEIQLNQNQRIILVSGDFRKEVTSTVMWLLTKYNLKIQCFKSTPYSFGEEIFLDIKQIIPVKEAEEFTIRMAEKAQEEQSTQDELKERHRIRLDFWKQHLQKFNLKSNLKSNLYSNISPSKDNWVSAGSGVSGVGFNFVISKNYARTEVYMSRSVADENKFIFDKLFEQREIIEKETGKLEWQRLDDKKASRIKQELKNVNLYEKDDWEKMSNYMIDSMLKIEPAFRKPLKKINNELRKELKE
ncbi:MAG: DUF4268 domain-containing protein [Weeksellaceae bacterium]|nr:DUF4268 domain-containing protein [Weeksellaceae bacterium]